MFSDVHKEVSATYIHVKQVILHLGTVLSFGRSNREVLHLEQLSLLICVYRLFK